MTLQDLFDHIGSNPTLAIAYFALVPLAALLLGWVSKGEELQSPWRYAYSGLIYAAVVPGIFAITLCVYAFLFSRTNLTQVNVIVYFLPILSMLATLLIVQRQIDIGDIPGFDKLSGLVMSIVAVFACMYFLDRFKILGIAFVRIPLYFLVLMFVALLLLFRFGMKRMFKS